jgi:predicted TIM-barrel fold metal-dependent hydrolase
MDVDATGDRKLMSMRQAYPGRIIDCCVHHGWTTQNDVVQYMSAGWQEYVAGTGRPGGIDVVPILPSPYYEHPGADRSNLARAEPTGVADMKSRVPRSGRLPGNGADYETICEQKFRDGDKVDRLILSFDEVMHIPSLPNLHLARNAVKAANDWTIDRWLDGRDGRLYSLMLVPCQEPDAAAAEIKRVGRHPRVVGVLLGSNGLDKPYGHSVYHPIYAAAAELDLVVVIHAGGQGPNNLSHPTGGGLPTTYSEYHLLLAQPLMTHIVSLIGQGVFEKFPELRVLLVGAGVAWIPSLLWRFDNEYRARRRDAPWLRAEPSEYFRRHFRVSTYPLDKPAHSGDLLKLLEAFGGLESVLCFGSGFPYWDMDEVGDIADRLPAAWGESIFYENTSRLFRWGSLPTIAESGRPQPLSR